MVNPGTSSLATENVESRGHGNVASPPSTWRSWLIPVATVLGFAIPAVSYLSMIHAYGVNVIYADQWDDVALIGHAYSGTLHLSTLWAQHYENRLFFPNLIVVALAYTTHFNVVTEEYLSALMLFGGTALVIGAHKRRSPQRRWIWYCPVAFLMLSLAQAANALWGFQMCWYLVLLMVALSLFLLDHEAQPWPVFGGAIAAAVVANFSCVQGLLVWPVGLLLIYLRRRPRPLAMAWIVAGVLTVVIYFVGFNFNAAQSTHSHDPAGFLTFFLRLVGDIVGEGQPGLWVTLFGTVLVVTAIWALVRFSLRERTTTGGRPFALSLVLFGLLVSGLTAYGRSGGAVFGVDPENRYTVFVIFVLVGLYLAVLDPPVATKLPMPPHDARAPAESAPRLGQVSEPLFTLARVVVGVGVVLTVILGSTNGISQARVIRENRLYLGQVTVRANQYPDTIVGNLDWLETPQSIRGRITIAKNHRLSLFGTGDAARYLSEKPLDLYGTPLRATVTLPSSGSTVHGRQYLDVGVSTQFDVTKVDYVLSGPGRDDAVFAVGRQSKYGWLGRWDTSTVPDGSYTIEAKVRDSGGRSVTTAPVEVRVDN